MSGPAAEGKGKGKATEAATDVSMGEDDSSSDEETGAEDEVCPWPPTMPCLLQNIAYHNSLVQSKEERKPDQDHLVIHQAFS